MCLICCLFFALSFLLTYLQALETDEGRIRNLGMDGIQFTRKVKKFGAISKKLGARPRTPHIHSQNIMCTSQNISEFAH